MFYYKKNLKPSKTLKTQLWGEIAQAVNICENLILIEPTHEKCITFILS
jgi:hypothetical protein